MLVRPFQRDIGSWVAGRLDEKLEELRHAAANFGQRVHARTREKNRRDVLRYEAERAQIATVQSFTYGTGSAYARGVLGHDDVLRIASQFLVQRPLFRTLLAQQFPFLFVDESQDTTPEVVEALKSVAAHAPGKFCLGFFGDPMQQIYLTGAGSIEAGVNWISITKHENFRSSSAVLQVANAIRRDGDGLIQTGGRLESVDEVLRPVEGSARMFILPADNKRDERVAAVRNWISREGGDFGWNGMGVKVLVIVHRMAAKRLGFENLYAAFNDKAPAAFKDGFLDASSWPLRPFASFVLPLVEAVAGSREFDAMTILRAGCPLLSRDAISRGDVSGILKSIRRSTVELATMMADGSDAIVRDVLLFLREHRLVTIDPRIASYLDVGIAVRVEDAEDLDEDEANRELESMDKFLACPVTEFIGYRKYVSEQSPFSTQQGVKGAEFDKVLVVADDAESSHFQFSYDKYFGLTPLSDRDRANVAEGGETQVDRTRRLFYVCCTRAISDLAVILFTQDPASAERSVREMQLFPDDQVFTEATMG